MGVVYAGILRGAMDILVVICIKMVANGVLIQEIWEYLILRQTEIEKCIEPLSGLSGGYDSTFTRDQKCFAAQFITPSTPGFCMTDVASLIFLLLINFDT